MAKDDIKLSEKHGVNPCIPVCAFCGNEKKEIALLGKLPNDEQAPKNAILDYTPCETCADAMAQGVTLIGVTTEQPEDDRPAIDPSRGLYPTLGFIVMNAESDFVKEQGSVIGDKLFCEQEVIDQITAHAADIKEKATTDESVDEPTEE